MKKTRLLAGVLSTVLLLAAAWKIGTVDVRAAEDDDEPKSVAINKKNFPDEVFRKYVLDNLDYDKDGSLAVDEITDSVAVEITESGVKDLTGIEYLTNLQALDCSRNEITKLDLSKNTVLKRLDCSDCQITKLDLRKCRELMLLYCSDNQLTELNISGLSELNVIFCPRNEIKVLDISSCAQLTELFCDMNKISKLDLSKCTQLEYLYCGENELTSLDLSKAPKLRYLYCGYNKLKELDLTKQKIVENIAIDSNQITSLKLGKKPNLTDLYMSSNPIGKLDVSAFKELKSLGCNECGLTELDVSHNTKLTGLWCSRNKISKLDVSMCPDLEDFNCGENPIGTLNLSKNTKLKNLFADTCGLTSLDVTKCTHLNTLYIAINEIKALDLSQNTILQYLNCCSNELTELDISNLEFLKTFDCSFNNISKISFPKADELETLMTHYNCFPSLDISGCTLLIERLKEFGVMEAPEGFFYSNYKDEYGEWTFFTVDMGVELKGYSIPTVKTFKDFVERLYTVALNRSSDPDGKAFWVDKVQSGEYNGADCARFFLLDAPEFMNRNLSVNDFVETLYKTFFDRASDAAGKKGWVDAINSGKMTRAVVVENFIESTEWCNVCATYGVRSGALYHKSEIASRNATKFATRLYTCCLGREPEEKGLQYWALALTNLEQTGSSAAKLFFTGDEFVNFNLTAEEYVRRLYTTFMDRDPEDSEVAYWAGEIAKGTQTRDSVLEFFCNCDEFAIICARYGILQ